MTKLLTRREVAKLLRVSEKRLSGSWGPRPLPGYLRPHMYSEAVVEAWLANQEAACSTDTSAPDVGTSDSVTKESVSTSPRVRQTVERLRKLRAVSEPRTMSSIPDDPGDRQG